MQIERTIDLAAPPAHVWTLLTDPSQIQRWMPDLVSDEPQTPGPTGVGTTTRMTMRERSKLVEYTTELHAYEPPSRLELEMRGGNLGASPMRVSYALTDLGASTRLVYSSAWKPRGFMFYLLLPLIMIVSRINLRRTLDRLAKVAASPAVVSGKRVSS